MSAKECSQCETGNSCEEHGLLVVLNAVRDYRDRVSVGVSPAAAGERVDELLHMSSVVYGRGAAAGGMWDTVAVVILALLLVVCLMAGVAIGYCVLPDIVGPWSKMLEVLKW
ncbi:MULTISPECIES: hypothetical protein [unclassified Aeromonas]|uniref:hypothetical protein n=1 Tax=unclassified Aeromonas TaxID=257493 RepID=UPI0022DEAF6C|nr:MULTISPECIES: hypothetical protein [unclassified Aeromonas]